MLQNASKMPALFIFYRKGGKGHIEDADAGPRDSFLQEKLLHSENTRSHSAVGDIQ
jgi:hypothetical protein